MIASGGDREGERERTADDVSKQEDDIETGAVKWRRDEPGGCPSIGQVVPGVKAARSRSAASAWNVGRHASILPLAVNHTQRLDLQVHFRAVRMVEYC